MPPQFVACGQRDFYRITRSSLQVFEAAREVPPPHIRGSSVARQMTQVDVAEPLNVLSLGKKRVLVIAKNDVFVYELGQTQARRHAPIATPAPLVAWSDPDDVDSFWVRTRGSESLSHYSLSSLTTSDESAPPKSPPTSPPKSPPSQPADASRVQRLPGFDSRLFTPLADGTPLYSTREGLLRPGDDAPPGSFRGLSRATLLFADSSPERYWAADASGNVSLWDRKNGESPVSTARVDGVVIDAAQQGTRVAVLSLELRGQTYQPHVTIFENGERRAQLSVGPSVAADVQPRLDLCLIAEHPWVVVAGGHWLQLLDWSPPRLLAEW